MEGLSKFIDSDGDYGRAAPDQVITCFTFTNFVFLFFLFHPLLRLFVHVRLSLSPPSIRTLTTTFSTNFHFHPGLMLLRHIYFFATSSFSIRKSTWNVMKGGRFQGRTHTRRSFVVRRVGRQDRSRNYRFVLECSKLDLLLDHRFDRHFHFLHFVSLLSQARLGDRSRSPISFGLVSPEIVVQFSESILFNFFLFFTFFFSKSTCLTITQSSNKIMIQIWLFTFVLNLRSIFVRVWFLRKSFQSTKCVTLRPIVIDLC